MLDFYASGFWQLAMWVAGVVLLGAALAYAVFKVDRKSESWMKPRSHDRHLKIRKNEPAARCWTTSSRR
jgi:hypothetical protein